ncbi:alpha/beta fold hydrolase [Mangrovimonas aestuarii]|uniref:alpha/beta fold hydrolase n=1 Tax=Mangrovimonas aestuarii TaxID=3018443 RepID=UPI002378671E|nr:alpha/beta hydrolase [Mangrovimonas aestuarii]
MPLLKVNDIDLDYELVGDGDPLLLLHGLGSTKKDWDEQVPFFSKEYKVITVDLRGHGNSSKPSENYGVPYMTQDIKQLLDHLCIAKVTVVGFSMGGAIAFQLAFDFPEIIENLVIVNSGPDFNDLGSIGEEMLASRTKMLREQGLDTLAEKIAYNMFPEHGQEELRNAFELRCKQNDYNAYLNSFVTLMSWGMGEKIKDIKSRTLVIASDMDYTPVELKKTYVNNMPNAILTIIPNSRHGVLMDQPNLFNRELYKFLRNG